MVNAEDFTYSKGYLGLLSMLGASLGIICCCVPGFYRVYTDIRELLRKRSQETPNVVFQAHSRSGRMSLDEWLGMPPFDEYS